MSICRGAGNGIGGALGKWGAGGLGGALGLGAAVDFSTRAITGYGLLETLNVPYIECPDRSFSTAIEWYGSGFKCPKRPESVKKEMGPIPKSSDKIGEDYAKEIEALGGSVYPYIASHWWYKDADRNSYADDGKVTREAGFWDPTTKKTDDFGNTIEEAKNLSGRGDSQVYWGLYSGDLVINQEGFGGWGSRSYPAGITYRSLRTETRIKNLWDSHKKGGAVLVGIRISLPDLPFAPPAADIPPPPGFSPNPPSPTEECEQMSCPCITPDAIEKSIKKALGINPFSPEKLIRELGAIMYAAPGASTVPVVPKNLVEAIAALVATTYMRAGYGRYPVIMPESLIAGDNPAGDAIPTKALENFAEWFEWHILQQDAIQGEWPIEIAIKDGLKETPMKFENLSEAIAEITGIALQTAADANTSVNAACTAAGIAQKAVNAASIGQKNIECLIRCFGFRTGFTALFVQSSITPMDPDDKNFNVRKFLTPSSQNLAVLTDNDPFDFQASIDRLLRNTEIVRASVARNVDKDGLPGDFARNQRKYDAAEARRDTEKEMKKLETSIKSQNPSMEFKIEVEGSAADTVLGDNFVIKRQKQ